MNERRRAGDPSYRGTVIRAVALFTAAGLVAMLILGVALALASRRVGEREAVIDARTQALVRAQSFVEPAITNGLAQRDPASISRIDEVVHHSVLDGRLVRVKIWTANGTIVYSDEPRLIGNRYDLGADENAALRRGLAVAGVSDLSEPENRFERGRNKLLEVYLPVRTPGGTRLLFEAYFDYATVSAAGARIWRSFAPIALGALVALELVQIPLAWSLARRLRQRQEGAEQLLHQAVEASDVERRRIAADLHDGVVQDLAGVAFSLSGAAREPALPASAAATLDRAGADVRDTVRSLRSLLVEIYPPNLFDEGLEAALGDLAAATSNRGVVTSLDIDLSDFLETSMPDSAVALIYRAVREALRNVVAHAHATAVRVTVRRTPSTAVVEVSDDGVGFDPDAVTLDVDGHFGVRGLRDLVANAGGSFSIESQIGEGTRLRIEVPA